MRVIAGEFRSRPLRTLPGLKLRPTSDRLRETLFNVIAAGPVPIAGSIWIDLFAGSGAVGIEAISRGAGMVYFVESSRAAVAMIQQNLKSLGIMEKFEILHRHADEGLRQLAKQGVPGDICFLDPPYADHAAYGKTLEALANASVLKADGTAIAEHDRHFDPGENFSGAAGELQLYRKLEQGDAVLSFYKVTYRG